MPGQEVERFPPALGIIPEVFLHVRYQLTVDPNPFCCIRIQLSAFLHLLEYPWLYERTAPYHMRQAAALTQPLLRLTSHQDAIKVLSIKSGSCLEKV